MAEYELLTNGIGHTEYKDSELGWIPKSWSQIHLSEVSEIFSSNVDKKSNADEIPIRLCNYMDVYNNNLIDRRIEFMHATAKPDQVKKFSLVEGDVLVTKDSETPDDIGIPAHVTETFKNVLCGYHLAIVRPDRRVLVGEYLTRALQAESVHSYFATRANGSTRFGLTIPNLKDTLIALPPLPEQKKIASILTSVDDVIEKTEVQISKLQDLKTVMMNELLTNGIGHTEFKDSELGRIPNCWGINRLADLTTLITKGTTPKSYLNDGINFIKVESISSNGILITENFSKIDTNTHENFKRSQLERDDILFSIAGSLGRMAIVQEKDLPANTNQALAIIRLKQNSIEKNFCMQQLCGGRIQLEINRLQTVGAQPNLSLQQISDLKLYMPPLPEQKKIASILGSVDDNIEEKQHKLKHTQSLKKSLMHDLLTGKVRVQVA